MFAQGLVEEVRRLLASHTRLSATAAHAIGYAEAIAVLQGCCTREQAIERTALRTRQLAKRQMTWFRRQTEVRWVDVPAGAPAGETAERVWKAWGEHGPTEIAGP